MTALVLAFALVTADPAPSRAFDAFDWAIIGTTAALSVYDAGSTRACLRARECTEANPLLGANPGSLRMWASAAGALALFAGTLYLYPPFWRKLFEVLVLTLEAENVAGNITTNPRFALQFAF